MNNQWLRGRRRKSRAMGIDAEGRNITACGREGRDKRGIEERVNTVRTIIDWRERVAI